MRIQRPACFYNGKSNEMYGISDDVLSILFAHDGRSCGYRNPRIVFTIQFIDQTNLYAHTNYFELNFCSADRISFPNGSLDNPHGTVLLSAVHFLSTRSRTHLFDI